MTANKAREAFEKWWELQPSHQRNSYHVARDAWQARGEHNLAALEKLAEKWDTFPGGDAIALTVRAHAAELRALLTEQAALAAPQGGADAELSDAIRNVTEFQISPEPDDAAPLPVSLTEERANFIAEGFAHDIAIAAVHLAIVRSGLTWDSALEEKEDGIAEDAACALLGEDTEEETLHPTVVALQIAIERILAARLAQAEREKQAAEEWKRVVIDALTVNFILTAEHETNPRKALYDLIAWECKCALNPVISKEAADLQEAAVAVAIESALTKIEAEYLDTEVDEPDRWTRKCHNSGLTIAEQILRELATSAQRDAVRGHDLLLAGQVRHEMNQKIGTHLGQDANAKSTFQMIDDALAAHGAALVGPLVEALIRTENAAMAILRRDPVRDLDEITEHNRVLVARYKEQG